MPAGRRAALLEAFRLPECHYVHLMGGGGKTFLMFALAGALAEQGRSVLTTTTTRIGEPTSAESDRIVLGADALALIERLRGEFATRRHVTVAASRLEGERKLRGLPVTALDALAEARVADHLLVEADGTAGRSLKAHLEHEPVLSPRADLVIAVVGVDCLGVPMDDRHVHRAALLRERLGRPPGAVVTPEDVAGILFHPDGYLARVGKDSDVLVFVNKAATPEALAAARALAETLTRADRERRIGRIVVGDVRSGAFEEA